MSLKIGMISSDLPEQGKKPGGVSIVVHELANALVQADHSVRLYSHTPPPQDAQYEVVCIPQVVQSRTVARRLILPWQMGGLDLKGLDVLHLHGDDWAFVNRSLPTIRTFHGCSLNEAKFGDVSKRRLMHLAYHPLEVWAGKLADVSVGVGDDTVRLLGAKYVVPNGYDQALFYPDQKSSVPTAIVIGTLYGRKQSKVAIDLLLSLQQEIPELVIHAVIDQPYEHPSVQNWIGIAKEQLAKLVRESWIGVSTSRYEGFGIYYLEWMASGTVPLSFNNIGIASLIEKAQAGILVSRESELRDAALKVLKDAPLRNQYAAQGIAASQQLSWKQIARQYLEIYAEAVAKKRSPSPS
jgi:phosphatidyl-myo-inositol alpha-mannosyltransferase